MAGSSAAIETAKLSKSYGSNRGVQELDLRVEPGEIYGFLGPNGAGKTTTIRLLLDLIRPNEGRATVFGHDSRHEAVTVHRLTGYLPGELALDPRLTGRQLVEYFARLRGGVDVAYVRLICERLELNLGLRFGAYSRGNKQKVGLLLAFMHRPQLLILDEPTAGLDPLNQETVLELAREARGNGATVFFSSHILSEVEALCDRVGFIRDGSLIRVGPVHELREMRMLRVEAECREAPSRLEIARLPGVRDVRVEGTTLHCAVQGDMDALLTAISRHHVHRLVSREPSLTEIFLSLYGDPMVAAAGA